MAGYAVESAIKVRLAEEFRRHTVPTKRQVDAVYSHDLDNLIAAARLKTDLETRGTANTLFRRNWDIVKTWRVESRYEPRRSAAEARGMLRAIADEPDGVLVWIRGYW